VGDHDVYAALTDAASREGNEAAIRQWILNAYYLPGQQDRLYPTISPVNSFRVIFDAYFGGKYDMLEDVSYFSPVPNLYDFSEKPNHCNP